MYVATKLIQKDIEFSYTNDENIIDNPKILINGKLSSIRELYDFINKKEERIHIKNKNRGGYGSTGRICESGGKRCQQ